MEKNHGKEGGVCERIKCRYNDAKNEYTMSTQ